MAATSALVTASSIERVIHFIRDHKVLLDSDLAGLYGVAVKQLNQAIKRNRKRFPGDFMFQLTWDEVAELPGQTATRESSRNPRSQIVTLKPGRNIKYRPYAFTEQGVAMLSSVLHSPRAIRVNIEIMRAFVHLRQIMSAHKDLASRIDELESKFDQQFAIVFDAIRALVDPPEEEPRKRRIGFHAELDD